MSKDIHLKNHGHLVFVYIHILYHIFICIAKKAETLYNFIEYQPGRKEWKNYLTARYIHFNLIVLNITGYPGGKALGIVFYA